jgi:hypothetical protein
MRFAFAAVVLGVLLALSGVASAQLPNNCATVVLHAISGIDTDCQTTLDCSAVPPTVRVDSPAGLYTVVVYLKNFDDLNGVQVAFDWPATWSFGFGLWTCQVQQLSAVQPTAPGPLTGSITTAFNAISGGALAPVGVMVFNSFGASGCLSIIESGYPFGNHVAAPGEIVTPLRDNNEGKICVGEDGTNTCDCIPEAVEAATWGQIKASYGGR